MVCLFLFLLLTHRPFLKTTKIVGTRPDKRLTFCLDGNKK